MNRSDSPASSPDAAAWWMLSVLLVTALVSYTDRLVLGVLVDPLRADLGLSDSAVSILQGAAFTLVYVFASLPVGRLADRGHRKTLLIGGASLWCLASTLCAMAGNFRTLFAGRLLIGIGEAVLVPTAVSMIADAFPAHRRGFAIGVLAMGTIIGGPLGISVGGLLLSSATAGYFAAWPLIGPLHAWRQALIIIGAAGLIAPLLLTTIKDPRRPEERVDQDRSLSATADFFARSWRTLLPLYAALALLSIGDYGLLSWAPTTLGRRFGWDAGRIGVAFGVVTALAGIAGAVGGGWLSDAADRLSGIRGRLLVCLIAAAFAAAAAVLISTPSAALVLGAIGLWTLASAVAGTSGVAALQGKLTTQVRATGMSIFTFTNTLVGLGMGPTLVALTTEHLLHGPAAVGTAITGVVAPAAVLSCIIFTFARSR
jgi:predicted MFS family arabinose efflux permease